MGNDVRVQIYTMQSADEAVAVAALGVDHVGVTPAARGLPGEVAFPVAADICAAIDGIAISVALSVESDPDTIEAMVRWVRPDVLHLCGPPGELHPGDVLELRRRIPHVAVMQAIAVTGPEAIDAARSFADVADYLILDSIDPEILGVGAAGTVHDWQISAAIVDAVRLPVLLAGGLSPANVASAVAAVNPWGVDSLTHTNAAHVDGGFLKDLALVQAFVAEAKGEAPS